MRNLNSTLLEGTITSRPLFTEPANDRPAAARFLLDAGSDIRQCLPSPTVASPPSSTRAFTLDLRFASSAASVFDASLDAMTAVVIVAEHIEIKRSAQRKPVDTLRSPLHDGRRDL